jgi:hypothetical protein
LTASGVLRFMTLQVVREGKGEKEEELLLIESATTHHQAAKAGFAGEMEGKSEGISLSWSKRLEKAEGG